MPSAFPQVGYGAADNTMTYNYGGQATGMSGYQIAGQTRSAPGYARTQPADFSRSLNQNWNMGYGPMMTRTFETHPDNAATLAHVYADNTIFLQVS